MADAFDDLSMIDPEDPCWSGYRHRLVESLRLAAGGALPSAGRMNDWLPGPVKSQSGQAIRFVPSGQIPGVDYERHIFETGQVSTRPDSLHDLFNAMVWSRFPALKSAMNACHYRELAPRQDAQAGGRGARGRLRDALTLLDESGAVVCSPHQGLLESLAQRRWREAFVEHAALWADTRVMICGHALLEKFPRPYKAITAHAIWVVDESGPDEMGLDELGLDQFLAQRMIAGDLFEAPSQLSPLPLMGIPGWWKAGEQDSAFYADSAVFRAPRSGFVPPGLHRVTTAAESGKS